MPALQKAAAEKSAASYGLEVVGVEQYKQDDADLSVQISKMYAAGARAILKIGLGGTTLTAAKNIKQLGLDMLMLTSLEDLAVFRPVAEVLGDKFFFVASPSQVYDALPDGALKKRDRQLPARPGRRNTAIAIRTGPAAAGTA